MRTIVRQIVTIVITIAVIVVNGLANALPLNGQATGEISDRFDIFFVPAGYVFAIWGLIYLGLIAFSVYQALPSQRDNPRLKRIGALYALSGLANIAWIFLWHYEQFVWTIVAMLVLLASLIAIYLRLGTGRSRVSPAETWLVRVPFSIYLGWITVATIANATQLLYYLNWDGWGIAPEVWAAIMIAAATIVTLAVSLTRGDVAYVLVIVWALVGIALKHSDTLLVAISAWVAAGVVLLSLFIGVPLHLERVERLQPPAEAGVRDRW
jgi:hypothetical protein